MSANIESRGDKFIGSVNRQVTGPEYRLPYGDPEVAFAVVSMVAAHYWDNPNHQAFVDAAFESAAHLEGQGVRSIAWDPRMVHITDKMKYGPRIRDESIKMVAALGAALVDGSETAGTLEEETFEDIKEELFGSPDNVRDVVLNLLEHQMISRQLAEGLLVVSGEVDTSNLDPHAVRRVDKITRHLLGEKVEGSFRKTSFPTINALIGNQRDGIAGQSIDDIIDEYRRKLGDFKKGEAYIQESLAHELTMLFSRRF